MPIPYPIVDVHTHMYPPSYIALLSSRTKVPYIYQPPTPSHGPTPPPRLIILSSDDSPDLPISQRGRPIDSTYSSISTKLSFMHTHNITHSVISLANPWLDFLPPDTAASTARSINTDLNSNCVQHNENPTSHSTNYSSLKLYAFGSLPLSAPLPSILSEIQHLPTLHAIKGVILGTSGLGAGLDTPEMDPIFSALASTSTLIFLHPHYGLPPSAYGPSDSPAVTSSGHVLPLALGFPMETTIAITKMFLVGVFDRHPTLKVLLAHSGGTLPFLAGRIESCIAHERAYTINGGTVEGPKRSIQDVLQTNIYLDAVVYGEPGLRASLAASGEDGVERMMFGTDHPFFPPLGGEEKWKSVESNFAAIEGVFREDEEGKRKVLGGNAVRVLGLEV